MNEPLQVRLLKYYGQMAPHQRERMAAKLIEEGIMRIGTLEAGVARIANECNCRAEHGAEGAEHLRAIEKMLRELQ